MYLQYSRSPYHLFPNAWKASYTISAAVCLAVLAQMVACLPLVQQVRGSIPGGVVNFNLKIFNLGAGWRRNCDVGEATEELENEL